VNAVSTFGDGAVVGASVAGFLIAVVALFSTFSQPIATARVHAFTVPADLVLRTNLVAFFAACIDRRGSSILIGKATVGRGAATVAGRSSRISLRCWAAISGGRSARIA
tara:strand:+ start:571 stop:897 length:327 start_codon:yes stop_codon:yes gene_type:complete